MQSARAPGPSSIGGIPALTGIFQVLGHLISIVLTLGDLKPKTGHLNTDISIILRRGFKTLNPNAVVPAKVSPALTSARNNYLQRAPN